MRERGKCKVWLEHKGYGFIVPTSGEGELFVHSSSLRLPYGRRALARDEHVSFEREQQRDGRQRARDVRLQEG